MPPPPPPTTVVQPPIWVIFPSGRGRGRQVGLSLCIHSGKRGRAGHHLLHGNPFSPTALRVGMHGGDQLFGMSFVTTQSLTCKSDNYFPGFLDHHFASPCQKAIKRSPSSQLFLAAVAESVFITDRLSVRPTERTC